MKIWKTKSQKYFDIGVDIGGTNTVYALVDSEGNIQGKGSFPTMAPGSFSQYVMQLATELQRLCKSSRYPVRGIGIGAPCGNSLTGEIVSPVHLGWGNVNLRDALQPMIGGDIPVRVTNDANAAALGEKAYGAAKQFTDFIEITLGTGVGSGIFVDGHLLVGPNGMAGELGHLRYSSCGDRRCGCGRFGCLDAWCSAKGLAKTAQEIIDSGKQSVLSSLNRELTSFDVFLAASEGDKVAIEVFETTGKILGNAIADMVTFSAPQAVILFGGLAQSGSLLLNPVREAFSQNVLSMYADTQIILSAIPEGDAAILGAAALNMEYDRP